MIVLAGVARVDEVTEKLVRAMIKGLDPLLDLLWVPTARGTAPIDGRYCITYRWHDSDKRWEMYRSGEHSECFDVLGWLTEAVGKGDFHEPSALPVDPGSILDRVVEFLGKCDNEREPAKLRMKRAMEDNALRREVVKKEACYEMFEHLEYNRQKLSSNPFVNLGEGKRENIIPRAR